MSDVSLTVYTVTNTARHSTRFAARDTNDALDQAIALGVIKNRNTAKVEVSPWNEAFTPTERGVVALQVPVLSFQDVILAMTGAEAAPGSSGTWLIVTPDGRRIEQAR